MEDIYKAPAADVTPDRFVQLPDAFVSGDLSAGKLRAAAVVALLMGVISAPYMVASFIPSILNDPVLSLILDGVMVLMTMGTIWLLLVLRQFMALRFNQHNLHGLVLAMIGLNLVIAVAGFLTSQWENSPGTPLWVAMAVMFLALVPYGVCQVVLGRRVLVHQGYNGLATYAWATPITGGMTAVLVTLTIAIVSAIVAQIAMAVVFFHGASELRENH